MSFLDTWRGPILAMLDADPRVSGQALCDVTTHAVDNIVIDACEHALHATRPHGAAVGPAHLPERWALTALGGYGRNQMCLRSDVDLQLVVPDDAPDPTPFMAALLDQLTSARLKVGHGVRTVSESLMLARVEPTFATAALTSRHMLGDPTITEAVRAPVYQHLAGAGLSDLVDALAADRLRRAERLGDTVFVLEPDLKHGIGGLRDAQLSGWLALVTGRPLDRRVMFAEDFLLKVRMALHAVAAFKVDRLAFEYQDAVADALHLVCPAGQDPAIELMRQVHRATRLIARRARRQLEYARDRLDAPSRLPLPAVPRFVRRGDRLARADGAPPRSPADVVDAMRAVALTGLLPEAQLEDGLEALAGHLDAASQHPDLNAMLLDLLANPEPGTSAALHVLHRTGLLTAIVPELDPIVGRIQRDLYHVYTVDEHSLRAVDTLKALFRGELAELHPTATACAATLTAPRALATATLIHDIGKGYGPGHHDRGAELAAHLGPRLGLSPPEVDLVRLLVRHQADMAMICMRRDLGDPRPIRSLARAVGDVDTLDALYLLTIADWSSVGPDTFSSWNRTMLRSLYEKTRELLLAPDLFSDPEGVTDDARRTLLRAELGEVPEAPGAGSDPIDDFLSALPTRYFNTVPVDRVRDHYHLWASYRATSAPGAPGAPGVIVAPGSIVVDVVAPPPEPDDDDGAEDDDAPLAPATHLVEVAIVCDDRPGLLSRLAGGLAAARLSVVAAEIYSLVGGGVLDVFRVTDPHRRLSAPRQAEALRVSLAAAVSAPEATYAPRTGGLPTAAEALPRLPTAVTASNDAASAHTVFDLQTTDRDGLLFDIAVFFRDHGLSIELAFVATEGRQAHDSFYVVGPDGQKLAAKAADTLAVALSATLAGN